MMTSKFILRIRRKHFLKYKFFKKLYYWFKKVPNEYRKKLKVLCTDDVGKNSFGYIIHDNKEKFVFYYTCPENEIKNDATHPLWQTYQIAYNRGRGDPLYTIVREKNITDLMLLCI